MQRTAKAFMARAGALTAAALLFTACGGGSGHNSTNTTVNTKPAPPATTSATTAPATTTTVATTTTSTILKVAAGSFSYSRTTNFSSQGYSFRASLQLTEGPPSLGNSTSLPPGQYAIDLPVSGELTIKNTTPGRDANVPIGLAASPVDGLWKMPSPACVLPNLPGGTPDALHEVLGSTWYCIGAILFDISNNTNVSTMNPGQTVSEPLTPGGSCQSTENGNGCPTTTPSGDDVFVYSQQYYKKVLKVLSTRPDVVLAYWEPGDYNSADVCTAGSYGAYAWVLGSKAPLPAGGACAGSAATTTG
jgi:hypothetical protein